MMSVICTGALLLALVRSMIPAHFLSLFLSHQDLWLYICERVTLWRDEIT